jgi:uncharacterized membrane protein YwzB
VLHVLKLVCCVGWALVWLIKFLYRDVLLKKNKMDIRRSLMFVLELVQIGFAVTSFAFVARLRKQLNKDDTTGINYHKETTYG